MPVEVFIFKVHFYNLLTTKLLAFNYDTCKETLIFFSDKRNCGCAASGTEISGEIRGEIRGLYLGRHIIVAAMIPSEIVDVYLRLPELNARCCESGI